MTTTLCVYQREANVDQQTETWVSRCGSANVDHYGAPPTSTTTTPPTTTNLCVYQREANVDQQTWGIKRGSANVDHHGAPPPSMTTTTTTPPTTTTLRVYQREANVDQQMWGSKRGSANMDHHGAPPPSTTTTTTTPPTTRLCVYIKERQTWISKRGAAKCGSANVDHHGAPPPSHDDYDDDTVDDNDSLSASSIGGIKAWKGGNKPRPPRPPGWPVVGNMFDLGSMPHQNLYKLRFKYGLVLWLELGLVNTMVVQSAKAAAELFKNYDQVFCDRKVTDALTSLGYNQGSLVVGNYGVYWRILRRLCSMELLVNKRMISTAALRRKCIDNMTRWIEDDSAACVRGGR
ncbi:Iridoid oxidase [Camellia lanceoleosa]|nr:Iridoid oxidase [Camellia lanceoleosa]